MYWPLESDCLCTDHWKVTVYVGTDHWKVTVYVLTIGKWLFMYWPLERDCLCTGHWKVTVYVLTIGKWLFIYWPLIGKWLFMYWPLIFSVYVPLESDCIPICTDHLLESDGLYSMSRLMLLLMRTWCGQLVSAKESWYTHTHTHTQKKKNVRPHQTHDFTFLLHPTFGWLNGGECYI